MGGKVNRGIMVMLMLVVLFSGCEIDSDDTAKIKEKTDDLTKLATTLAEGEHPKEKSSVEFCENNIKQDLEERKYTAPFPFKTTLIKIIDVSDKDDAMNKAKSYGMYTEDIFWFEDFDNYNNSFLGIAFVQITNGMREGENAKFYYGCDPQGNLMTLPKNMLLLN